MNEMLTYSLQTSGKVLLQFPLTAQIPGFFWYWLVVVHNFKDTPYLHPGLFKIFVACLMVSASTFGGVISIYETLMPRVAITSCKYLGDTNNDRNI